MRYSKARSIANAGAACKAKTSRFLRGSIRHHHNILCLHPNPTPISAILPTTSNLPNSKPSHALPDTPHDQPRHSSPPFPAKTTTFSVAIRPNSQASFAPDKPPSPDTQTFRPTRRRTSPTEPPSRTGIPATLKRPARTTGPGTSWAKRTARTLAGLDTNLHEAIGFHSPRSRPSSSTRTARVG